MCNKFRRWFYITPAQVKRSIYVYDILGSQERGTTRRDPCIVSPLTAWYRVLKVGLADKTGHWGLRFVAGGQGEGRSPRQPRHYAHQPSSQRIAGSRQIRVWMEGGKCGWDSQASMRGKLGMHGKS